MISRYRVQLNGTQFDSLDKNILILDVAYSQPDKTVKQYSTANSDGYDVQDVYVRAQAVTISFELRIYDTVKRNEAVQKINEWASGGGMLQVNDRDGQFLNVICDQYAVIQSVRNWTDPLTLVFVTKSVPYWCSVKSKTLTLTGKSAKGTLKMDGNIGSALISVNVVAEGAISSLQIVVGNSKIILTNLSVPNGKTIKIDYINDRYLRIFANGSSVLSKLKKESTDNLCAVCGQNSSVSITANNKVTATLEGRGLWI